LVIVSFCESDEEAEWLEVLFCITRGARTSLWRGASGEGESGVPEEVPPQASSQNRPISNGYGGPDSLTLDIKLCGSKGEEYEGGPRRVAERKEGPQVGKGPRGGYRFGLASRANLASERIQSPNKIYGPRKSFHPWTLSKIYGSVAPSIQY